jgi:hypothetical protein
MGVLNPGVMIAAKIANLEQAATDQAANLPLEIPAAVQPISQPEAARILNVSERAVTCLSTKPRHVRAIQ